jgi:hypothetical protein
MLRMHFFDPAHSLLTCLVATFDADDDLVTGDLSLNATSTSRGSPVTRSVSSADSATFARPATWLWIMKTTVWNALVRFGTGQCYSPLGAIRRNLVCRWPVAWPS